MRYEIRKVDELSHHGILGQKWGIRRYQYNNGSLTDEGRKRYGSLKEHISKWAIRQKEKKAEKQEAAKTKKETIEKEKQEKQEKLETDKRKLIEFGNIDEIKKNLDTFSPSEMTEIRNRFATELQVREQINKLASIDKPVSDIIKPEKKTPTSEKVTNGTKYIADNAGNLAKAATQATLFYNQVTKASNVLLGTSRPIIA